MIVSVEYFSSWFLGLLSVLAAMCLVVALWQAPWRALLQKSERQHALFAAWLSLVLMMKLQVQWIDGITLHFLVMTTLVVIFGWSFSLIIGAAAQLLAGWWQQQLEWGMVVNFWLSSVVPASVAYLVFRLIVRHKSNNLFIFLLGGGFFGAIVSLLLTLAVLLVFLLINGQWEALDALFENGLVVVLLCYSEGFINGLLVTAVTVFFPGIVKTFDEKKYLDS